jgi:hypothetical protein
MFATILAEFRRPDIFESATELVCINVVTHLLMALPVGILLTPNAV